MTSNRARTPFRVPHHRPDDGELTVSLTHPNELFSLDDIDMFQPNTRLQTGMEELTEELMAGPIPRHVRITVELPRSQMEDVAAATIQDAMVRHCQIRLLQTDRQLRFTKREGVASLPSGILLFLFGLAVSVALTRRHVPEFIQIFLGNGAFLVAAWVGLWYPLDTLLFSRRPLVYERRALTGLIGATLTVREREPLTGVGQEPGSHPLAPGR